ncbi:Hypothetical protein GLP15_9 [Giardia lamblia P15]|uniref:Uncharacterized protein n=1 Tax=Giardia intestinalis (strain P15) TaxID=658858 RepID=E1EWF6_GIAIA|nr:Hypothetical protein GLP15_9 [Giardia lamblia P15]
MKKQSRSSSVIPYGCEVALHTACEIDLTKSLRKCVGSLPLYAIMNALMCLTTEPKNFVVEDAVEKEEGLCSQEPLLKATCTTPISLQTELTPPGTDFGNRHVTTNYPLPAPPQLTGSEILGAPALPEPKEESLDESSSASENKDQSFMPSVRLKKSRHLRAARVGRECNVWLLSLLPQQSLTTSRFLTIQKSFLCDFPITSNMLVNVRHSLKWVDALAHLYEYVHSLNALDLKRVHPCHQLYLPVFHRLQAWCTLLNCADGSPLFDGYRTRLTFKVSSLAEEVVVPLINTSGASLETVMQAGKRLEEFITNAHTVHLYE